MLARIERKLAEIQRWVDSVYAVGDVPAAIALALHRTRPSARPRPIWVRPARLGGFSIRINAAAMSDFVIYEEMFIDDIYDLDRVAFVPDGVIDGGAYHGYFSLMAAARFPGVPVIAFEPNAANVHVLRENVARNGVDTDVRASAISTRDGSASFHGEGCGGHLEHHESQGVTVPMTNLARIVDELRCERLLVKLDIEGEEAAVLPAILPHLPRQAAIFFEWHHGGDAYARIADLLSANGFSVTTTRENRLDDGAVFIDAFAQR